MPEIKLTKLPDGQIRCEIAGDRGEIAVMVCQAMIWNVEIASIFLSAIPSYLDECKIDRTEFCEMIKKAHGSKDEKNKQPPEYLN